MAATRYLMTIVAAIAFTVVVLGAGPAAAGADDDDCEVAQQAFSECVSYVVGVDTSVSPKCCMALGDVKDMGDAAAQRRTLCRCILSEMLAAGQVVSSRAMGLPDACKIQVGFIPTSPDFDCSTIP
ncbi:hypothetical protein EJB05_46124 [Eragrostis curvula]|uniref:Non-specific lipid-transfer protein n=1 Tax=Eragrostis curvula TaxID=38414 RepID=A0A5J9TMC8_9POAL|nr:hypothetical protein EJB05_46124 [Eragrostis curvula]